MFSSYPRLRLVKWRDFIPDPSAPTSKYTRAASHKRLSLTELTNPKRDLINLTAVIPQANHRKHLFRSTTPIIKKNRNLNDISNLYPSLYTKKVPERFESSQQDSGYKKPYERSMEGSNGNYSKDPRDSRANGTHTP